MVSEMSNTIPRFFIEEEGVITDHRYLILKHLWNESTYKIHLLLQVWNEIIADNEYKLGRLGESKFIHMTVNGGGL